MELAQNIEHNYLHRQVTAPLRAAGLGYSDKSKQKEKRKCRGKWFRKKLSDSKELSTDSSQYSFINILVSVATLGQTRSNLYLKMYVHSPKYCSCLTNIPQADNSFTLLIQNDNFTVQKWTE